MISSSPTAAARCAGRATRIRFYPRWRARPLPVWQGDERRIYEKLGAQLRTIDGVAGTSFAVWSPNARRVSVVGDFNQWDGRRHPMRLLGVSGVWEIFIPGIGEGAHYKFEIESVHGQISLKTDPYGFFFEVPPKNASIVWNNQKFAWTDQAWLEAPEAALRRRHSTTRMLARRRERIIQLP